MADIAVNTQRAIRLLVGVVLGAHGVKGLVKVKSFTQDPKTLFTVNLVNEQGQLIRLIKVAEKGSVCSGIFLVRYEGVSDRSQADTLKGSNLYIKRGDLPQLQDSTYYHGDMIGLKVVTMDSKVFGTVEAMHNFGAGDLVEIRMHTTSETQFFHFRKDIVSVRMKEGILVIDPPTYIDQITKS